MTQRSSVLVGVAAVLALFVAVPSAAQRDHRRSNRHQSVQTQAQQITCSSQDNRRTTCRVNWRGAELRQQLSRARCVEGRTWGLERGALWVDKGCRGVFADSRRGWQPGAGWDRQIQLTCQSQDKRYQLCQVDVGRNGSVRMQQQLSDASCVQNRSWGWNRAGVWVDQGCRARFVVDRRW